MWLSRVRLLSRARPSARLCVEALEDRLAPAITVTTLADVADDNDGLTSLREALTQAESTSGAATIQFAQGLNGSLQLLSNLPAVNGAVSIQGPGASLLAIRGYQAFAADAIFQVSGTGSLTIADLTLAGGDNEGGTTADSGGAIKNAGTASVSRCVFSDNHASFNGGAIYTTGALTVDHCRFSSNSAQAGGAIFQQGGTATITGSTFATNTSTFSSGGAIMAQTSTALAITGCTFSANSASAFGGALWVTSMPLTVVNSTLSGNTANRDGGGLFVSSPTTSVRLTTVTITGNRADADGDNNGSGGGIDTAAAITMHNSIVAGNFRGPASNQARDEIQGGLNSSSSYNLVGDGTGSSGLTTANHNQVGTSTSFLDPLLLPLADNGGLTLTQALASDSPARDAGSNALALDAAGSPLTLDQRGFRRVNGGTVDIGAFEFNNLPVVHPGATQDVFSEGQPLSLGASGYSDADGDALSFSWDVNNDGDFSDAAGASATLSWDQLVALGISNGPLTFPVRVRASDGSGQFTTSEAISVELRNVPPTVAITGDVSTRPEGTAVALTSSVSEPSPADTLSYSWDVTRDGAAYTSATTHDFSFTPDDEGTYVVILTVSDDGGPVTDSKTITVTNAGPTVHIEGAPTSSPEGTAITLSADASDAGTADTLSYAWTVTKDGDDYDSGSGSGFLFTPDDNGTYVVKGI